MRPSLTVEETRWLECAARMGRIGAAAAQPLHGTQKGRAFIGRGAGGDRTMEIDLACENAMVEVLRTNAPAPFSLVSEELGYAGTGDAPWRVVLDPLDGSLNAKRGLKTFAASIAIADGGQLADVRIAHIDDYVHSETFTAVRGAGLLQLAGEGQQVESESLDDSRFETDSIEVLLLEAGRPDGHDFEYQDLSKISGPNTGADMRVRQIGSLALALCYVAVGVGDVLVAAVPSRSVDVAAGLLILREAGGGAASLSDGDLMAQPLDLEKRCAFIAWRRGLDGDDIVRRARQISGLAVGYC